MSTDAPLHNPLLLAAIRGDTGQLELKLRLAQFHEERLAQLAIVADDRSSPLDRLLVAAALGLTAPDRAEALINTSPVMQAAAVQLADTLGTPGGQGMAITESHVDLLSIGNVAGGHIVTINIYPPKGAP